MMKMTFNRLVIATALIYFPLANLGSTHSYLSALFTFGFIAGLISIGYIEREEQLEREKTTTTENKEE